MEIVDLAKRNRNRLDATSQKDLERLIAAYGLMSKRLKDKLDLLMLELKDTEYTVASVKKMKRYKEFVNAVNDEFKKFNSYLEVELDGIVSRSESQGKADAIASIKVMLNERINGNKTIR